MALAAAPLGCLLAWRRLIYFGEALAHASLLGVALALWQGWALSWGIWLVSMLMVLLLFALQKQEKSQNNQILGTLSHLCLALGVVLLSRMEHVRTDLQSYLFGDVLATQGSDVFQIALVVGASLLLLKRFWRAWVLSSLSPQLAQCELKRLRLLDALFLLLLATFMASMVRYFGLLLVVSLLIIPAHTANRLAKTPEASALWAMAVALTAAILGTVLAWYANAPPAPAMVVVAGGLYLLSVCCTLFYQK